jgi:hypothetical protein
VPKDVERAKADLATIVPHLRVAAEDALRRAKDGAKVEFAIIAKNPDGSGQVGASFECEEFLSDLETVFPPSEDDVMHAKAACLVSKLPGRAAP